MPNKKIEYLPIHYSTCRSERREPWQPRRNHCSTAAHRCDARPLCHRLCSRQGSRGQPQHLQAALDIAQSALDFAQSTLDLAQAASDLTESALDFAQSALDLPQSALDFAQAASGLTNSPPGSTSATCPVPSSLPSENSPAQQQPCSRSHPPQCDS